MITKHDAEEFFRENREAILSAISVKPIEMMTALCDNPYSLCKEISGIVPMNGYPKGQVFYKIRVEKTHRLVLWDESTQLFRKKT